MEYINIPRDLAGRNDSTNKEINRDNDGEDKLGQQMVNLSLVNDWGIVDVFLLPGFRERTYAGEDGRLRGPLVVDDNNVSYESSAGQQHLDFALRWAHSLGEFDFGSYWFHGTNREAYLSPSLQSSTSDLTQYSLQQHYAQMDQLGVDVQATLGDWLWKFESIYRTTSLKILSPLKPVLNTALLVFLTRILI